MITDQIHFPVILSRAKNPRECANPLGSFARLRMTGLGSARATSTSQGIKPLPPFEPQSLPTVATRRATAFLIPLLNPAPPTDRFPRPAIAGLLLALAVAAAYLTSFRGVMVLDDFHSIVENPTIRDLGRLDRVLFPPAEGGTIAGRPLVNLTLALNYATGGLSPGGYHAVNLGIHLLAALTLFGLVRRTALRVPRLVAHALPLALAVSALWALHPLQTAAVTYLIQRAESLAGLCYLLTLYCFARAVLPGSFAGEVARAPKWSHGDPAVGSLFTAPRARDWGFKAPPTPTPSDSRVWLALSFFACLCGMATKEVMASAPLVVLLYDRTFAAGSWREAWRRRGPFHAALFGTWVLLAVLVLSTENRGGTAGFGTAVNGWEYALTQCDAIVRYLRLSLWPHPLVFDHGTPLFRSLSAVAPQAGLLLLLLGVTGWALVRRPALGFCGACFFLILAPSSSVVPVATQTMAEHRMYLPLAAVLVLVAVGAQALAGRRALVALLALAAIAGILTARRNLVYHSELALWSDTVAHRPDNPRAHTNLGIALAGAGRLPEAAAQFEESLRLDAGNAASHLNLCHVLTLLDQPAQAVPHGEEAVRLEPGSAAAHINLGRALALLTRTDDAIAHYEAALRIEPDDAALAGQLAALHFGLGNQAAKSGDFAGAIARYRQAVTVAPDYLPARNNLANALMASDRVDEAIVEYREVLRQSPGNTRVQENLDRALEIRNTPRR
jgi:tetratricopeptide (TPR) repeat protein